MDGFPGFLYLQLLKPQGGRGQSALVQVRDKESGIPPDVLPHLFDRFWHTDRSLLDGSGLGLAIALTGDV